MTDPVSLHVSWQSHNTTGATRSGLIPSIMSTRIKIAILCQQTEKVYLIPGGKIPFVNLDPAMGTIVLQ